MCFENSKSHTVRAVQNTLRNAIKASKLVVQMMIYQCSITTFK